MKPKETEFKLIAARLWCGLMLSIAATFSQAAAGTITNANWTPVGSGMNGSVFALAVMSSNLYAGGAFTNASGSNYVARWDGSSWTQVGAGWIPKISHWSKRRR